MIKSFRHKGLEELFNTGSSRGVDARHTAKLRRMMLLLHVGPLPAAMRLPSFRLHELQGDKKGTWSARVSGNVRLTFEIESDDATNVWYGDYH